MLENEILPQCGFIVAAARNAGGIEMVFLKKTGCLFFFGLICIVFPKKQAFFPVVSPLFPIPAMHFSV